MSKVRLTGSLTFDNNYFNDFYQGIPIGGYTQIVEKLLKDCDVQLSVDFFSDREKLMNSAEKIIFTGAIDSFFDYAEGELEYRSLRFENEILDEENFQGNAVINYTDSETPFTRIIEHKHFEKTSSPKTIITREYPKLWHKGDEPYYPVNNEKNSELYKKYESLSKKQDKVFFGGRLGMYKYFDMDDTVEAALNLCEKLF